MGRERFGLANTLLGMVVGVVGVAATLVGCTGDDTFSATPEEYVHDPVLQTFLESDSAAQVVLGVDDSSMLKIFSSVTRAAVNRAGDRIVVADRGYPLLRVFNREGDLLHAMGDRGEGPGEMTSLQGVAMSPEGEVAVLHDFGRFTVFDLEGAMKASTAVGDMHALAVSEGCAADEGEWVIYGPRPASPGGGDARWLHRVRIEADTLVLRSTFPASAAESRGVRRGGPHGLFLDDQGRVVVHHEFSDPSQLARVDCDDWEKVELSTVGIPEAVASSAAADGPDDGTTTGLIGLGTRLRRGALPVNGDVMIAASIIVGIASARRRTLITLSDGPDHFVRTYIDGRWTFHDVTGTDDILASTNHWDVPRALLLDGAAFNRALVQ